MAGHNHYAAYTSVAADAERQTDYLNAASLWKSAAHYARSTLGRDWAERRSAFCHHAAQNGWGKSDECAAI
ncbi:ANR family transcriptional regulator [Xenorhabdus cabanillasii]|uniref:ANR family transcriptional regulator n=1 Tax=Xenorhabdus cabanillasii JM26 TaxID=1427517 RepID=W1IP48_9GAMM|nr:ANR family transcriptional regulator [Xenorhabdus cabanillasii]CDL80214.1 conserved hypothetical protein [Xenorhabdus cabanillasii JM26]